MGSTLNFSLLDKVIKLCKKEKKKQNQDRGNLSVTWLLFSQGSSMIIAIGFFMTFSENVFDKNSMQCYTSSSKEHFVSYVVNYCWMHGTYFIEQEMHGSVTPCVVKSEHFRNTPITQYYIWLPYLLIFLFVLARLPYEIWKRVYNERITLIFNGDSPHSVIFNFLYYSFKYDRFFRMYSLLEMLNTIFLIFSITFTHLVFNNEFLSYGYEAILYFWNKENIPNPGCRLFPTEVNCRFNAGSHTGIVNQTNFLCILSNNLFNQIYFFVLWSYWMCILFISSIGIIYRILRLNIPLISKQICLLKIENPKHRKKLMEIKMTASEWFMLEYLLHRKNIVQYEDIIKELCTQIESWPSYAPEIL